MQVIPCIIKGLSISPDNVELWNRGESYLEEAVVPLGKQVQFKQLLRFDRRLRPSLLFAGLRMVSSGQNVNRKNIEC